MSDGSERNRRHAQLLPASRAVGLLFAFLMAGCTTLTLEKASPADPVTKNATQVNAAAAAPAPDTSKVATPLTTDPPEPKATVSALSNPEVPLAGQAASPPAKVGANPKPAAPPAKGPASVPAKSPASPPLNLKSLETRLKDTKAIGVFTKIALKNQVDDLLDQFRAYYQGQLKTTLADLRRPYEMLLQKVLALLQDSDPPLAGDIVASREAIWGILTDRAKFAAI